MYLNHSRENKKIIRIASPIQDVINTLNKARELYYDKGIDLKVIKTNWTEENIDLLKNGTIDGLIYTNIHVFKAFNEYLKKNNQETFVYIQPFYHSKYGLYINKENQKNLYNLDKVKKYKKLKVLLAVSFSFIQPCDMSRSLLLLNNLELIHIPESVIKTKKLNISLEDIQNPYELQFIKTSQIPCQFEENPDEFDLMANWPAFMNHNPNFVRIGSNITDDKEPENELVESYAIALISRKDNETSEQIDIIKQILNDPQVKQFHVDQKSFYGETNYVMINNPELIRNKIIKNWLDINQT
ncbi:MetQ/NlpA family ABC transporter substrate-binding protein [Candidatus Phytoplasma melaleucae]|uniref:MetQ/NlpA family ABC transporter substrate-binding protein n=1 Tax=Candidatus Phytoplasma melaleucae TaxID=2982630 RepID=A0ABT9DDZ2_9MOLU|nr:MetQ/NlpA family ABC transporter substrate-binding protein ['Melaleuca sp.' phytoplasma]MDO8168243.1 MetQ/NlpA family ABC transporter substrate-binding protein ['Melaleuca sp.' phytoplasma]MDV3205309.1 MetQ/NlpA family ABC transporter substrate-binding protein [Weeping tea tree witches'-broom phytoplasma]